MPYTSLTTVASGDTIDPAWGNLVDTNLDFLANPPACRVYHNTVQAIPDASYTVLNFNSERFDTAAMHDTATNNSRITITVAGIYIVSATAQMSGAGDYNWTECMVRLNGATEITKGSYGHSQTVANGPTMIANTVYKFAVSDYIEFLVFQDNTASASRNTVNSGNSSQEFAAVWVGLG